MCSQSFGIPSNEILERESDLIALDHHTAFISDVRPLSRLPRLGVVGPVRAMPIRWRIGSIAVVNAIVVVVLASLIWSGATLLNTAWDEVRRLRESDALLTRLPLTLVVDVPAGISMNSYPGSYGQVLTNLFLNTVVHAYPDGCCGTLTVRARPVSDQDVDIAVADDGIGMTEEVRLRAFDPFFTTRRNHGGTGLGLHVIFNIVTQSLGGRLVLASAPGRGATFRIRIPRHAHEAAATTE
jgi:signal transduction histidine kinase